MTSSNPYLVSHDQLPAWCKCNLACHSHSSAAILIFPIALSHAGHDNPAIINGYRRVGGSGKKLDQNTSRTDTNPRALSRRTSGKTKKATSQENGHRDVYDTEEYQVNTFWKCWRSIWDYWHNETGQSKSYTVSIQRRFLLYLLDFSPIGSTDILFFPLFLALTKLYLSSKK